MLHIMEHGLRHVKGLREAVSTMLTGREGFCYLPATVSFVAWELSQLDLADQCDDLGMQLAQC